MDGQILSPNQSPFPSSLTNTPEFAALLASPNKNVDVGTVREDVAIGAPDGSMLHTPKGPINDLMSLRQRYPFLPILPMPHETGACVLVANTAVAGLFQGELTIPDGMAMGVISFAGVAGALSVKAVYANRNGNADIPAVTGNTSNANASGGGASFLLRNGSIFYLGGIRSIGFASTEAATITAEFYSPDQYPR